MRKLRILATIVFVFITVYPVLSQSEKKKYDKAYEAYNAGEYFEAIDLFKVAYEDITSREAKLQITFDVAECYRKINDPKNARRWYQKAIAKNYEDPIAVLYEADMLKMIGEYEEAKVQYNVYKELMPTDARADKGILSCDLALEWIEFPSGYKVEEMKYLNSKHNDFSPSYARGDHRVVYFTSTREGTTGKSEHGGTGEGFADIFTSTMDRKGKWSSPVPITEEINTEFEEGTPSFSSDYNTMYFTRCAVSEKDNLGCAIYYATLSGEDWNKAELIEIGTDSTVIAHPAISPDELTLYFVSDMEGSIPDITGKPSKDIWMVARESVGDDWGEPVNMGEPINTGGSEVFPFVHYDGAFYFSSNGHVGMGGLDIFKANKNENGTWEIENMRSPVNSSSDDFGICFEHDREAGFFTSTRKGRSDDIYNFVLPPLKFSIEGIVRNEKTDAPLNNSKVKSVGSDGITLETVTDENGAFKFMLNPQTDYRFIAQKEGYLKGKERETTKNQEKSIDFNTVIYLPPIDEPITVENIFFDLDSYELRPESMVSLDQLVATLNENPITIELSSHTDFRGNDDYNQDLSQSRAQSVVDYLISKGIAADRLIAKGYGESMPKVVDKRDHEAYPFLPEGHSLTENFINTIEDDDLKEVAHFLNRRTEFKVLTTNYGE